MYGLCRVRSTVIEGLAELMNINAETQSERAGAVTKQQPLRSYDAVQMSTRVHITYNLQNLHFGYQPEDGHPSIGQSILALATLCIIYNIQFTKLSLLGAVCPQ